MTVKKALFDLCMEFADKRHRTISDTINGIQTSLQSETKSSAGDKHETGRAMLQLEREKAGVQLAQINKTRELLSRIDTDKNSSSIGLGSVVYTTKRNYFVAISAGELLLNNESYFAVSPSTPIGQLLLGKMTGDDLKFKGEKFTINKVI